MLARIAALVAVDASPASYNQARALGFAVAAAAAGLEGQLDAEG